MVELEKVGVENTCPVILYYFSRSTQFLYCDHIIQQLQFFHRTKEHVAEPSKAPYPP